MNFNRMYPEIFIEFQTAPTRKEKIDVLRRYDSGRFREFLFLMFSPNVEFDVEIPKTYKVNPEPEGMTMSTLHIEVSRLYRFIKGHPKKAVGLTGEKQKNLLINVLESIHKDEAELLIKVMKRDVKIPYLTAQIVKEAFPGINL
jgi:hypothetical protein